MLAALVLSGVAHAGAMMGAEYVPSGLGDMAWVESEQLSGSMVAEHDGMLVPPLTVVGGYAWDELVCSAASPSRVRPPSSRPTLRPSPRGWPFGRRPSTDTGLPRRVRTRPCSSPTWAPPGDSVTTESATQASKADRGPSMKRLTRLLVESVRSVGMVSVQRSMEERARSGDPDRCRDYAI